MGNTAEIKNFYIIYQAFGIINVKLEKFSPCKALEQRNENFVNETKTRNEEILFIFTDDCVVLVLSDALFLFSATSSANTFVHTPCINKRDVSLYIMFIYKHDIVFLLMTKQLRVLHDFHQLLKFFQQIKEQLYFSSIL
jgi:hypothetical protein